MRPIKNGDPTKKPTGYYAVAESTSTQSPIDPNVLREANELSDIIKRAQLQEEIQMLGYPFSWSGRVTPVDSPLDYIIGLGPSVARGLTRTALKSAYKLNPFANKLNNPSAFYRIAGRDAFEDAMSSGVVRSITIIPEGSDLFSIMKSRPTSFPSYAKGAPNLTYLRNADDVIFKNSGPMYKRGDILPNGNVLTGRHWAYRPYDEVTEKVAKSIPVEEIYEATPHWLMGHKKLY